MNRGPVGKSRIRTPRDGVAIVEGAIVLGAFLLILLGSLDLVMTVLRDNTLAEAARRLARAAIVHGDSIASVASPWGPADYTGTAAEETEYAAAIRDILITIDPADVQIQMTWPDGGNATGDRVEVTVSTEHRPIVASLIGAEPYRLQATSTMQIEH